MPHRIAQEYNNMKLLFSRSALSDDVTRKFISINELCKTEIARMHILDDCPALSQYTIDEGEFVRYKGRGYTWLHISQNGVVRLPENTMRYLNLSCGDILMSIKSSDIAFTMGARGPLMDKVHSYPGHIKEYRVTCCGQ